MNMENTTTGRSALPWLVGCGGLILLLCVAAVALFVMNVDKIEQSFGESLLGSFEEWGEWGDWGVQSPNEMSEKAIAFVEDEGLVKADETLLGYYDKYGDRTEVAVLTDGAIRYYKNGRVTDVPLKKVDAIKHHERENWGETVDVILIRYDGGKQMKVEVLETEGGATLYEMTKDAWKEAKR